GVTRQVERMRPRDDDDLVDRRSAQAFEHGGEQDALFRALEARSRTGGEHDGADPRHVTPTVTLRTTIGWVGCSIGSPSFPMRSTTSSPLETFPTIAYSGGNPASAAVTTKNWLPEVPAGSAAVFAIATVPS